MLIRSGLRDGLLPVTLLHVTAPACLDRTLIGPLITSGMMIVIGLPPVVLLHTGQMSTAVVTLATDRLNNPAQALRSDLPHLSHPSQVLPPKLIASLAATTSTGLPG